MGGDQGPRLVVEATFAFLKSHPDVSVSLVGQQALLEPLIAHQQYSGLRARVQLVNAEQTVEMGERAGVALRQKQQSSMWRAVQLLADGKADACISAGNTGALMAIGRRLLKTCANVRRPAICKSIPTVKGTSLLLDLGANIDCSASQLVQFAIMGSALAHLRGVSRPRVALLSIGTELGKGSDAILLAARSLAAREDLNFVGLIEGFDLYAGTVDVVVCDGLMGNVALKVSEGIARFIFRSFKQHMQSSVWSRILVWLLKPMLVRWFQEFNPSAYNGAAFLGLKRTLIKSHGGASSEGFQQALVTAIEQVKAGIPERIDECLQRTVIE